MVATAKHQQQTMDINYGLFYSFRNISDKNREEYDLKKHQSQHIVLLYEKQAKNTHVLETIAKEAKWRPRRDQDGKNTSFGFVYACFVVQIYIR